VLALRQIWGQAPHGAEQGSEGSPAKHGEVGVDDDEFESHVWSLQGRFRQYAQRRLGADPAAAEDVVAETLLTLWRKGLAAPADEAQRRHLRAMAFLVLNGHIRNHLRARRRHQALTAAVGQAAACGGVTKTPSRPTPCSRAGSSCCRRVIGRSSDCGWRDSRPPRSQPAWDAPTPPPRSDLPAPSRSCSALARRGSHSCPHCCRCGH
jgi:hypothetical protein